MKVFIFLLWAILALVPFENIAQWLSVGNSSMYNASAMAIVGNDIFIGTTNNGVFRSTNNGDNWESVNNGLPSNTILALGNNLGRIFGSTQYDIVSSTNLGANWVTYYNGLGTGFSANDFFFEGNTVYAAGFGVYFSNDNGANWARITSGLPQNVYSIARKGSKLFAATNTGVYYSTDNGLNWQTSGVGLVNYIVRSIIVGENNIIAGTDSSSAFISTDDGATWTKITSGIPLVSRTRVESLFKISGNLFAGLGYNPNGSWGIYRSTDDGITWSNAGQGISALTSVNVIAATSTYLFASVQNGGVFRRLSSDFGITDVKDTKEVPTNFVLLQNYPNPFNPSTKISWHSPISSHQTLKVYDVLGNEVAVLVDEFKEAGAHKINFDASKLVSGVFFYKLQAGSICEIKKMILLR